MSLISEPAAPAPSAEPIAPNPSPSPAPPAPSALPTPSPSPNAQQSPNPSAPVGGEQPWYTGFYDKDAKIDPKNWDKLPDHLKPYKDVFSRSKSFDDLLMSYANAKSLAGKKGLAPIPENAPPEVKAERAALLREINGTPQDVKGYGVERPKEIPEDQWNGEYVDTILAAVHKHHGSKELVKDLLAADQAFAAKQAEAVKGKAEAAAADATKREVAALDAEWKNPQDKAKNLDLVWRAARTAGLDPNDPFFAKASNVIAFSKLAAMLSEDKFVSGATEERGGAGSDHAKALDIVNNPSNPHHAAYHDSSNPLHKTAVAAAQTFFQRDAERRQRKP